MTLLHVQRRWSRPCHPGEVGAVPGEGRQEGGDSRGTVPLMPCPPWLMGLLKLCVDGNMWVPGPAVNLSSPFLRPVCIPVSFLILWLWSLITSLGKEFPSARCQKEINRNPELLGWLLLCKKLGITSPCSQPLPAQCLAGAAQHCSPRVLLLLQRGLVATAAAVPFISSSLMPLSPRGGSQGSKGGGSASGCWRCWLCLRSRRSSN